MKKRKEKDKKSKRKGFWKQSRKNFILAWKELWGDCSGVGVVELILILVVLIGLVLIFKSQLTTLVNHIFDKITSQSGMV